MLKRLGVSSVMLRPPASYTDIDLKFKEEIGAAATMAGADRFLLGTLGSWGEGIMTDEEALKALKDLNAGAEWESIASTSEAPSAAAQIAGSNQPLEAVHRAGAPCHQRSSAPGSRL